MVLCSERFKVSANKPYHQNLTTSSGAFVVYSILIVESTHTLVVELTVYTILVVANLILTLVVTHTLARTLVVLAHTH